MRATRMTRGHTELLVPSPRSGPDAEPDQQPPLPPGTPYPWPVTDPPPGTPDVADEPPPPIAFGGFDGDRSVKPLFCPA